MSLSVAGALVTGWVSDVLLEGRSRLAEVVQVHYLREEPLTLGVRRVTAQYHLRRLTHLGNVYGEQLVRVREQPTVSEAHKKITAFVPVAELTSYASSARSGMGRLDRSTM